jgi:hypothetical protein
LSIFAKQWACARLPFEEIVRVPGFPKLIEGWPRWRHIPGVQFDKETTLDRIEYTATL